MMHGFRVLALLVAAVIGFVATSAYVNSRSMSWPGSPSGMGWFGHAGNVIYAIRFEPQLIGPSSTVQVAEAPGGVEIASRFNPAESVDSAAGAAYFNIDRTCIRLPTKGRFSIEIDATYALDNTSQYLEVRFVQNGLRVLKWQSKALRVGRQAYTFDYTAVDDPRPEPKIDTIWIRGDADGRGRPVTLHGMRVIQG